VFACCSLFEQECALFQFFSGRTGVVPIDSYRVSVAETVSSTLRTAWRRGWERCWKLQLMEGAGKIQQTRDVNDKGFLGVRGVRHWHTKPLPAAANRENL
jgi:hypothetical protein